METVRRLLDVLGNGQFHSGEYLAAKLGMTRAGIWKLVARANEDFGVGIIRSGRKGYSLDIAPEWLDVQSLRSFLRPDFSSIPISIVPVTGSTNEDLLKAGVPDGARAVVLLAEHQTAGRGRRGRTWISGLGRSVCCSVAWRLRGGAQALEGFSLAVGLRLAEALTERGVPGIMVKWPNDLLVEGAKMGGILIEVTGDPTADCLVVVGVGLNLYQPARQFEAGYRVGSLFGVDAHLGRNQLAGIVVDALLSVCDEYPESGFRALLQRWSRFDFLMGREVCLVGTVGSPSGVCEGVSDRGALQVRSSSGLIEVHSGEVSVRVS